MKYSWILANDFFATVAGDSTEGRVDVYHGAVGIGDDNTFLCFGEHAGGEHESALRLLDSGDVACDRDEVDNFALLVVERCSMRFHPALGSLHPCDFIFSDSVLAVKHLVFEFAELVAEFRQHIVNQFLAASFSQ